MSSNLSSSSNAPSSYQLYPDDIEEVFLESLSMRSLLVASVVLGLLTIGSLIILVYRSTTIFLACFVPLIYALILYDFTQLFSIVLLKYNLLHIGANYFGELCRWPYYLKASAEAGQCLTLVFIYGIRRQKLRYFTKNHYLPNSSRIHSRALTFICFLFIVYVNNWVTHLKVEKSHRISTNESSHEVNIGEYPIDSYELKNYSCHNDSTHFYADLERYAEYPRQPHTSLQQDKSDSNHLILVRMPYNYFAGNPNPTVNRSKRRVRSSPDTLNGTTGWQSHPYCIHRCTYGQENYFVGSLLTLVPTLIYLIAVSYYATTIVGHRIPKMTTAYHQKLFEQALVVGRRKSADRHQQFVLLTRLAHFQYLLVYCHTSLVLTRLLYTSSLILILWFIQSPFQWPLMKVLFHSLFHIVLYSIPVRIIGMFVYLFASAFSSSICSVCYHLFRSKLHFSCQWQRPSVRLRLHIVPYDRVDNSRGRRSSHDFVMDLASTACDEFSNHGQNDSTGLYDENSTYQPVHTTATVSAPV